MLILQPHDLGSLAGERARFDGDVVAYFCGGSDGFYFEVVGKELFDGMDFCVLNNGWFVEPVYEVHDAKGAADEATLFFKVDVNEDVGAEEDFFDPLFAV